MAIPSRQAFLLARFVTWRAAPPGDQRPPFPPLDPDVPDPELPEPEPPESESFDPPPSDLDPSGSDPPEPDPPEPDPFDPDCSDPEPPEPEEITEITRKQGEIVIEDPEIADTNVEIPVEDVKVENLKIDVKHPDLSAKPSQSALRLYSGNSRRNSVSYARWCVGASSPSLQLSRDRYSSEPGNQFRNCVEKPLSTVSIDVDTASYSNIRRFLNCIRN